MEKQRILLVDDDVSVSRTLKMYLDENGAFEVRVENVGSRAIRPDGRRRRARGQEPAEAGP